MKNLNFFDTHIDDSIWDAVFPLLGNGGKLLGCGLLIEIEGCPMLLTAGHLVPGIKRTLTRVGFPWQYDMDSQRELTILVHPEVDFGFIPLMKEHLRVKPTDHAPKGLVQIEGEDALRYPQEVEARSVFAVLGYADQGVKIDKDTGEILVTRMRIITFPRLVSFPMDGYDPHHYVVLSGDSVGEDNNPVADKDNWGVPDPYCGVPEGMSGCGIFYIGRADQSGKIRPTQPHAIGIYTHHHHLEKLIAGVRLSYAACELGTLCPPLL
jgi:hypothetical protein